MHTALLIFSRRPLSSMVSLTACFTLDACSMLSAPQPIILLPSLPSFVLFSRWMRSLS